MILPQMGFLPALIIPSILINYDRHVFAIKLRTFQSVQPAFLGKKGYCAYGNRLQVEAGKPWWQRIRRRTYANREQARADIFNFIEFFYDPKRKHGRNGMLSPIDFERQQKWKLLGV